MPHPFVRRLWGAWYLPFAAFAATLCGYQFGLADHQEHLPLLYRALDSEYLPGDFFLNANARGFDPRYYFSLLVGAFLPLMSIASLYWWLTFLGNWVIAGATARAARLLFEGNALAAPFAVALVMSVPTVSWGSVSALHVEYLTPNALAFSLVLWAMVWAWRQAWLLCGAALGVAALLHPLVGPECGVLLFGTVLVRGFWQKGGAFCSPRLLAGMGLWAALSAVQLMPYFVGTSAEDRLPSSEFLRLYAHFRNPHHILPSYFLSADTADLRAGLYLWILGGMLWYVHYGRSSNKALWQHIALLVLGLAGLAFAGWFFVEIQPLSFVATAQTFRLLYIAKWLVLLFVAGILAHWAAQTRRRDRLYAGAGLLLSFVWTHLPALVLLRGLADRTAPGKGRSALELLGALVLTAFAGYALYAAALEQADFYVWLLLVLLLVLPRCFALPDLPVALAAVLSAALLLGHWLGALRTPDMHPVRAAFARQYDLDDLPAARLEIARRLQALTPPDAQIIAPPMCGEWRFLAQRALVVDFKTYPFGGQAFAQWQQRLFDVYGYTEKRGFDAVQWAFVPFYEYMHDAKLDDLAARYGATHAVLYSQTPTEKPILYQNAEYKIVRIVPAEGL